MFDFILVFLGLYSCYQSQGSHISVCVEATNIRCHRLKATHCILIDFFPCVWVTFMVQYTQVLLCSYKEHCVYTNILMCIHLPYGIQVFLLLWEESCVFEYTVICALYPYGLRISLCMCTEPCFYTIILSCPCSYPGYISILCVFGKNTPVHVFAYSLMVYSESQTYILGN